MDEHKSLPRGLGVCYTLPRYTSKQNTKILLLFLTSTPKWERVFVTTPVCLPCTQPKHIHWIGLIYSQKLVSILDLILIKNRLDPFI